MSFDYDAYYDDLLRKEMDAQGDIPPPWAKFPEYTRHTIGWRMGSGEDWMMLWWRFIDQLGEDPAARRAYLQRQRPAPHTWARLISNVLHVQQDLSTSPEAEVARLREEGFIADDVAYPNWRALHGDAPPSPWDGSDDALHKLGRYRTRPLFLYGRFCADEGRMPELPEGAPPPLDAGFARLAWEGLRDPWVPPPWELGCARREGEAHADDADYGRAWRLWVRVVFDDQPTWTGYITRRGAPPEAWRALVEELEGFIPAYSPRP